MMLLLAIRAGSEDITWHKLKLQSRWRQVLRTKYYQYQSSCSQDEGRFSGQNTTSTSQAAVRMKAGSQDKILPVPVKLQSRWRQVLRTKYYQYQSSCSQDEGRFSGQNTTSTSQAAVKMKAGSQDKILPVPVKLQSGWRQVLRTKYYQYQSSCSQDEGRFSGQNTTSTSQAAVRMKAGSQDKILPVPVKLQSRWRQVLRTKYYQYQSSCSQDEGRFSGQNTTSTSQAAVKMKAGSQDKILPVPVKLQSRWRQVLRTKYYQYQSSCSQDEGRFSGQNTTSTSQAAVKMKAGSQDKILPVPVKLQSRWRQVLRTKYYQYQSSCSQDEGRFSGQNTTSTSQAAVKMKAGSQDKILPVPVKLQSRWRQVLRTKYYQYQSSCSQDEGRFSGQNTTSTSQAAVRMKAGSQDKTLPVPVKLQSGWRQVLRTKHYQYQSSCSQDEGRFSGQNTTSTSQAAVRMKAGSQDKILPVPVKLQSGWRQVLRTKHYQYQSSCSQDEGRFSGQNTTSTSQAAVKMKAGSQDKTLPVPVKLQSGWRQVLRTKYYQYQSSCSQDEGRFSGQNTTSTSQAAVRMKAGSQDKILPVPVKLQSRWRQVLRTKHYQYQSSCSQDEGRFSGQNTTSTSQAAVKMKAGSQDKTLPVPVKLQSRWRQVLRTKYYQYQSSCSQDEGRFSGQNTTSTSQAAVKMKAGSQDKTLPVPVKMKAGSQDKTLPVPVKLQSRQAPRKLILKIKYYYSSKSIKTGMAMAQKVQIYAIWEHPEVIFVVIKITVTYKTGCQCVHTSPPQKLSLPAQLITFCKVTSFITMMIMSLFAVGQQ